MKIGVVLSVAVLSIHPVPLKAVHYQIRSTIRRYTSSAMSKFDSGSITRSNPLLSDWKDGSEFSLPPFAATQPSHFEEALNIGMKEHLAELNSIATNPDDPTFDNTIAALDRSGQLFFRVYDMFENLCSSNGVQELQAVELKMAAPLASHFNQMFTFPGMFQRIDQIHSVRTDDQLGLNSEQVRLVERFHLDFVRQGAKFSEADQRRYAQIVEQLAELCTKFTQVGL